MMLRFVPGLVFVRSSGRCPPSLMSFLTRFALVGLTYFANLPGFSMFVLSTLSYHQQHQALHWGAAAVHACSLASLTWLFVGSADSSAYHRLSKVSARKEGDMTSDLAMPSTPRVSGAVLAIPKSYEKSPTIQTYGFRSATCRVELPVDRGSSTLIDQVSELS